MSEPTYEAAKNSDSDGPPPAAVGHRARTGVVAAMLRNPLGVTGTLLLALVVAVSLLAPVIAPADPNVVDPLLARQPPGPGHPLGGDGAGRDVLSRLIWGGRMTLLGALVTAAVAMVIGIPAGLLAGYFGRMTDAVASWLANLLIAIPGMVILLAVIAAIGPRTVPVMAVFGVLLSPGFFRLVRTAVQNVRSELYIDAAKVSGLGDGRIIRRHVLSVVRAPIVIQVSISAGVAVLMQTGLQFLGLGEQNVASWGQMLADAFTNIYAAPHLVLWPGVMIGMTVTALALIGSATRDALQDRSPVRRQRDRAARNRDERSGGAGRGISEQPTRRHPDALLEVGALSIAYPGGDSGQRTVVDQVDLAVDRGRVLGIVGESGSGKSQTVFSVLGLLPAEAEVVSGAIWFDGVEISAAPLRRRRALLGTRIGYVPQEPMSNLDPSFTIGHQLVEPMTARLGMSRRASRERGLHLLERVGIPDPKRTFAAYPHQISGGMAQRVLIAGAISCDPDVVIADEPTTALDVTVQAEVLDLLREIQRERGMALIIVTHNLGVVADICDDVAVMRDGRVVERAEVHRLFSEPEHEYTRVLLDSTIENAPTRAPLAIAGDDR